MFRGTGAVCGCAAGFVRELRTQIGTSKQGFVVLVGMTLLTQALATPADAASEPPPLDGDEFRVEFALESDSGGGSLSLGRSRSEALRFEFSCRETPIAELFAPRDEEVAHTMVRTRLTLLRERAQLDAPRETPEATPLPALDLESLEPELR